MRAEYLCSDAAVRILLVLRNTRQLIVEYLDLAEDEVSNERKILHMREGSTAMKGIFKLSSANLQRVSSKNETETEYSHCE
jgi:hypothetical protein